MVKKVQVRKPLDKIFQAGNCAKYLELIFIRFVGSLVPSERLQATGQGPKLVNGGRGVAGWDKSYWLAGFPLPAREVDANIHIGHSKTTPKDVQ